MSADALDTVALELHGDAMWSHESVGEALDLVEELDMNALVFHSGDLLNCLVFPRAYFTPFSEWGAAPPRRGENAIYNARAYIAHVIARAKARNVSFYLELKEIGVCDEFIEMFPALTINGVLCPTHPKWLEFIHARYEELCVDFPEIAGVIVSVGSPEGRVTLASRRCQCERCKATKPERWYGDIIDSIYEVLERHGKRLVIREFSYNRSDQQALIRGINALPSGVEVCIKPYARDFYPTYPDNGALALLHARSKWLEYDVNGQYYGWGVFPCPMASDLITRLQVARSAGVTNLSMRVDWERVNDLSALRTFNRVNLVTGALLATGLHSKASARDVLVHAARLAGVISSSVSDDEAGEISDGLLRLWPVVEKSLYIRGFVFNHSSMLPNGVVHAWWNMASQHK